MKLCSACSQTLPKESFSKRQWLLNQHQRKCKECVDANQVVQLKAPPKIDSAEKRVEKQPPLFSADNEGASCWICLEAGPDDDGRPLRRDCSCRGTDAGFAHVSCIVEYAKQKTQQQVRVDVDKLVKPWSVCLGCHQLYQNELALDLATELVNCVEETYPDDLSMQLNALWAKLRALASLMPTQKKDAKQVASKMISMIGRMRNQTPLLAQDVGTRLIEETAYGGLGNIALTEGTKESAKEAVRCFEKQRDICKAIGSADLVSVAERNIACAMSKCEGGADISVDEKLKRCRERYKADVKHFGQQDTRTIYTGVDLAITHQNAYHRIEAERLLIKLASNSKRVHGPDHQLTQRVESHLQECKVRVVGIYFGDEAKRFQALQYEDNGNKCVVQGPIATPRNIQNETEFTVDSTNLFFGLGTAVVCHGLKQSAHLNGKIGNVRAYKGDLYRYEVHFEDKELEPCLVKRGNIRIIFELPDEL